MIRRVAVLGFLAFSGFMALSCSDGPIESPVEPQFAKKVKPTPAEPVLKEFWVYEDLTKCPGEIIHIVASGTFDFIATKVTHDHFFNGIRDMGFHFEFGGFRGPEEPPTEWNNDRTEGHVDVCFQGEQIDYVYGDGSGGLEFFVDYPSTSVNGTGADPFAITVGAVIDGGGSKGFDPAGVVVDGETMGTSEAGVTSSWHGGSFTDVRSYAVMESPSPAGYLFFDGITISNASCQVSTTTIGKGKKKTEVTTTTVTAEVEFDYGAEDIPETGLTWDQDYRGEGHLRIAPATGSSASTTDHLGTPIQDGTATYTWSTDEDLTDQDVEVEFLADFLIGRAAASIWEEDNIFDYVYDPGRNHVSLGTTAGVDGGSWGLGSNVSQEIYDGLFPVAHSNRFSVTCGGG